MPVLSGRGRLLLASFALIPLLHFPRALLADRTLFTRDIGMVWAPQIEAVVRQVSEGRLPAWDDHRAFGQPLFADPRAEILYPPAWIHWVLPPEKSYTLFCALHLLIAAWGAARLVRRLVPGAPGGAEIVAGLVYAAGGPLLSLVSHWHHLAAAAWMPWIVEKAAHGPEERTPWLGLSILFAVQILAGSPDYTFSTVLCTMLVRATRADLPLAHHARLAVALTLGLMISSVQLLPSLAFARAAARDSYPVGWALSPLHPAATVETILPVRVEAWPLRPAKKDELLYNSQVWMFSHYLGLSSWALALLGLRGARPATRRFALGCVVLGLVMAWGVRDQGLQSLVARVPLVAGLRFPTKHLAVASLGLSVLAAFGVTRARDWTRREKGLVAATFGVSVAWGVTLFLTSTDAHAVIEPGIVTRPLAAAAVLAGVLLVGSRLRPGSLLLAGLVAVDLLFGNSGINPTIPGSFFRDRPPLTASIPKASRLYVSDYSMQLKSRAIRLPAGKPYYLVRAPVGYSHPEALALAASWYLNPPSAGRFGYSGSFDLDVLDFYRAPLRRVIEDFVTSRDPDLLLLQLQRGSVDYVVTMDPPGFWNFLPLVREERGLFDAPVRVFRVPDPWPRVRLESADGARMGNIPDLLAEKSGAFRVKAEVRSPSQLVFATAYDEGWQARVDGRDALVQENDMAFVSVPLSAGPHLVELRYRPPWIGVGAMLSGLGVILSLVLVARESRGGGGFNPPGSDRARSKG